MSQTLVPVASAPVEQGPRTLLHRIFSLRTLVKGIVSLVAAVAIATVATGGTYALWNQSALIGSNGTVAAGNPNLAISSALSLSTSALYPGATNFGSLAVANTGSIPLTLTAAGLARTSADSVFAQSLALGLGFAASAAACSAGTWTPTWTGTFASAAAITATAPVVISPSALGVGSTAVACVSIGLPTTAPAAAAGQPAATLTLQIAGRQI